MALKLTKVKLDLFYKEQEDMHEFIQRWLRGENSMMPTIYMDGLCQIFANRRIQIVDINNLSDIQILSLTAKQDNA
ncbi:1921_t:CDS:2 [Funneliformis mosseae]|uniref:1921_t:CDS:1 n=1 Tax=Funneliformis mosseae TaxID=27381 RepID=A0A9N9A4X9_FUNMO|nr:1921_t:CDS:2 [Funneliformis mosseae]